MDIAGTAVGIASLGIQVCEGLLSYYDTWKSYDSDISSTYNAITDLSKTLTKLKTTLQQETDKEGVGRVRTCVNSCEDALLELEKRRYSLQKYGQPEGLRQKMRAGLQRTWYKNTKKNALGSDELESILLASIMPCSKVYLLIDALDECPEDHDTRQTVLGWIERLTKDAPNLRVLATSRELPKIRDSMAVLGCEPIGIDTSAVDADIRTYIASQLSRDRSFVKFGPATLDAIKSTIASKSDGMYV
jgi:hypothetical protein